MKVKYLGTLFAASVLSMGLVTSCATPEGGDAELDTDAGVEKVNPCAGKKVNPCAGEKVNPCAGEKVNPCAGN